MRADPGLMTILTDLVQYVCGEGPTVLPGVPEGSTEATKSNTHPRVLAAAMEHQQARAEVFDSSKRGYVIIINHLRTLM